LLTTQWLVAIGYNLISTPPPLWPLQPPHSLPHYHYHFHRTPTTINTTDTPTTTNTTDTPTTTNTTDTPTTTHTTNTPTTNTTDTNHRHLNAVKCIASLMNNAHGLKCVISHPNSMKVISQSLHTSDIPTKIKVLEILGPVCLVPEGLFTHIVYPCAVLCAV
jgi:hypothetical protein